MRPSRGEFRAQERLNKSLGLDQNGDKSAAFSPGTWLNSATVQRSVSNDMFYAFALSTDAANIDSP